MILFAGKKRKAKENKKGGKKKKKRKNDPDSDAASEVEFDLPVQEEDVTPRRSKKGKKETAAVAAAAASADDKPSVEEVCENFGLTDVDLEYTDADYQNLTNYKLFQSTYRQRIQVVNPKVRY